MDDIHETRKNSCKAYISATYEVSSTSYEQNYKHCTVQEKADSRRICTSPLTTPTSMGHVHQMNDDRIPNDIMYGELTTGNSPIGRQTLHLKDFCKMELKHTVIESTGNNYQTIVAGGAMLFKKKS